jgi:hypothetical protein
MRRMAVALLVAGMSGIALHGQGGAPSLDVVGIRIGMTVKEAATALKAANPRLRLAPGTRALEGFPQPLLFSIIGNEDSITGPDGIMTRAPETITLLFTTPPSPEVVWGVKRVYNFRPKEQPEMQNMLDALRKKYGPESLPASSDRRDLSKYVAWVYDAQGKPMGPSGAPLNMTCAPNVGAHFGSGDDPTLNEIQSGRPSGPPQCQSITIVNANVLGGLTDQSNFNSTMVVRGLIVQITDGSRHKASVDATRAVALGATKSRENKEDETIKKRPTPKI